MVLKQEIAKLVIANRGPDGMTLVPRKMGDRWFGTQPASIHSHRHILPKHPLGLAGLLCLRNASNAADTYPVLCLNPGQPVPHAEILDEILTAHISNKTYYNPDALLEFILGNGTKSKTENLALNVLDVDNVRKIIANARKQYSYMTPEIRDKLAYQNSSFIVHKALEMMQQSIYQTRYRIKRTKPLRDKYSTNPSFNIAVLYGAARQIVMKMDNLYGKLSKMPWNTHFIWYLILYEKLLALNVDVDNIVQRIFIIHNKFIKSFEQTGDDDYYGSGTEYSGNDDEYSGQGSGD